MISRRTFNLTATALATAVLTFGCQAAGAVDSLAGRLGQHFPDLEFEDAEGRPHRLSEHRGQVVLVHFWASWCAPCRTEKWQLQKLYNQVRDDPDIAFVILNVKEDYAVGARWAEESGLTVPLFDSRHFDRDYVPVPGGRSLRVDGIPDTVILDADGVVVDHTNGRQMHWEYATDKLRGFVDRPSPALARGETARAKEPG